MSLLLHSAKSGVFLIFCCAFEAQHLSSTIIFLLNEKSKKKKNPTHRPGLALKSIPHPGIFGGFGRNVFFLQYGDFIKKPEVLILLSKTTT